jgi:ABC-type lipoprotein release transport system permease subunit
MATQLFQVQSWDPKILIGSTLALAACAMIASVLPARRAASTDPLKALRTE